MLQKEMDLFQLLFDNFLKLLYSYFDFVSIGPGYHRLGCSSLFRFKTSSNNGIASS